MSPQPGSSQQREQMTGKEIRLRRAAGLPYFRDEREEGPREDKYRGRDNDRKREGDREGNMRRA